MTNNDITAFLVGKQIDLFDKDNEKYFNFLRVNKAARAILNSGYRWLVRSKEIKPIEEFSGKQDIWKDAVKFSNGELSKEETIEYAKAIYTIKAI